MCASGDMISRVSQRRHKPAVFCKNLRSGGSRVLPSLATLAWDQIADRSVCVCMCVCVCVFFLKMKRKGINIGQAENEKTDKG